MVAPLGKATIFLVHFRLENKWERVDATKVFTSKYHHFCCSTERL